MAEFDDRWRRLVAAAREAGEPASLAWPRFELPPPAYARGERRSLVAIAALLACVFFALLPCRAEVGAFLESAASDLAALPTRVPRPPHPPSAAIALEALPDLHSLLDLTPFTTESPP